MPAALNSPAAPNSSAIGIDVGFAKVKVCAIDLRDRRVSWFSRPLPYDAKKRYARHADFERGLAEALGDHGEVSTAVVVMTNGYAYPSFEEGAHHTLRVIGEALPKTDVRAFTIDGRTVTPAQALDEPRGIVPFTNGVGAAHLARRSLGLGSPANGLVTDTGGDTTQVNPVVDGELDATDLDRRLRGGRFVWIGSQSTPLEALASEVEVDGQRYPVIPRGVTFDHVSALTGLLPEAHAKKLSLFGLHPSRELALRGLAEAVNLDTTLVDASALERLATAFLDIATERLARELGVARAALPEGARERIAVFGLGRELARRAARHLGIREIIAGADLVGEELSIIASAYGAAHRAAEIALDCELPAKLEVGP